jgi:LacI family transcriptional regulator, repressor for deo operon, udp, cdd, tsx, nupC, and nupG
MQAAKNAKKNMIEVAAAAGVSVATVSRALQRPELVTEKTRRRVHEAIRRLDYTPNAQARTLRTAQTKLIIAMVADIANPFFSEIIRGIEQVAYENGYSVLLGDTQNIASREQAYADMIAAKQADGLITLIPHVPRMQIQGRLPFVNACECVKDRSITCIGVDNVLGAVAAVNHLVTLGHHHIGFVSGPAASPLTSDRRRGYELALREAGIALDEGLIASGDFSAESGLAAVEILLARKSRFTALFCSNDEMAIGAIRALKSARLRVPEDVSVVGFDDIRFAKYTDPPLTTVAQPKNELGREAMNLLMEILSGGDAPTRKRVLPTDLVVRGSTAPRTKSQRR